MRRLSVRIADAHRRLVRTIRLHYHSKTVGALTDLRMPENAAKWRLAATVHVSGLRVYHSWCNDSGRRCKERLVFIDRKVVCVFYPEYVWTEI